MESHQESPLRLRGHHLICLHFFHNEGYTPDFITNLEKLLKRAEAGEDIQICSGPDSVCLSCPYLKNHLCSFESNAETAITEMDAKAIQLLKLKILERVNWQHIREKIPIVMPSWATLYCRGCSWKAACEKDDQFREYSTRKLKVNFEEIQKAMEDVLRDTFDYYLDTETGDVLSFSEEILEEVRMRLLDTDSDDFEEQIEYVEFDEEPELPDWMFDEIELAMEIFLDASGRYIAYQNENHLQHLQPWNNLFRP